MRVQSRVAHYRYMQHRRLPHLYVTGRPLFVTFRLQGSLPAGRAFPPQITSGEAFVAMDQLLDNARSGPRYLGRPEVAGEVKASLERGAELKHYALHAWVIMPNHVHLLITPLAAVSKALQSLKGATARRANLLLGLRGAFWQDESYDHLVRSGEEMRRIHGYIENNPVKAALARCAEEYLWSSAWRPERPPQAESPPHSGT
jgi:putative transposase